jgi:DNA-binding LacI/PurR family transcriptional regulator
MQLLALKARPDGIFCYNDPVAIGAMRAILENGMRIPEDVALIGSGNLHLDTALRVPLSTVDQQCQRIGQSAGARQSIRSRFSRTHPRCLVSKAESAVDLLAIQSRCRCYAIS